MSTESTFESGASAQIRRRQNLDALLQAATQHAARLSALSSAKTPSDLESAMPRPGETYLSRSTADFPVEWLVVDQQGPRCRVLPVDEFPLAGSEDFRFPRQALGGPQVGRCGFSTWLDTGRFERDLRTGALSPSYLKAVQSKLAALETATLETATLEPKPSEDEVDGDPEYHLWRDRTLRRAVAALDTKVPAEPPKIVPLFGAPPPRRFWTRPLAVAAMLLMVVVPAAWTVLHLMDSLEEERLRVAELVDASETQAAELESVTVEKREVGQRASRLESELLDLRQTMDAGQEALTKSFESRIDQLRRELARTLAQAVESKIVENIPVLRLDHRSRRSRFSANRSGGSFEIGDKGQVLLEVDVHDPEPYPTYEVCLRVGDHNVLCLDGLTLQDGRFLRVALPVERLEPDDYTVTLKGKKRGTTTELDEQYDVRIKR